MFMFAKLPKWTKESNKLAKIIKHGRLFCGQWFVFLSGDNFRFLTSKLNFECQFSMAGSFSHLQRWSYLNVLNHLQWLCHLYGRYTMLYCTRYTQRVSGKWRRLHCFVLVNIFLIYKFHFTFMKFVRPRN